MKTKKKSVKKVARIVRKADKKLSAELSALSAKGSAKKKFLKKIVKKSSKKSVKKNSHKKPTKIEKEYIENVVCDGNLIEKNGQLVLTDIFFLSGDGFCGRNLHTEYDSLNIVTKYDMLKALVGSRIEAKGTITGGLFAVYEWTIVAEKAEFDGDFDADDEMIDESYESKARHEKILKDSKTVREVPNVSMTVSNKEGQSVVCNFRFLAEVVLDRHTSTYVAECNGVYGEGLGWSMAVVNCIEKMAREGMLVS